jgi:ribonuclease Z
MNMRFELIVLGTSAALPVAGRYCSGQLLCMDTEYVLIDCGEGTQQQLQRVGEGLGKLQHILITHLHGDHYFGLPGLLTSMALGGRTQPLTIVSPPGLKQRISGLLEYDHYQPPFPLEFIERHCAEPTELLQLKGCSINGFPLQHRVPTNGYLIREHMRPRNMDKTAIDNYQIPYQAMPDIKAGADYQMPGGELIPNALLTLDPPAPRSFAYCSDTAYFEPLAEMVGAVDLLYHEATFLHAELERAELTGHSTARQAAMIARSAAVGQLLIGHFSARYADLLEFETEAKAIFPNTRLAKELYRYHLPLKDH